MDPEIFCQEGVGGPENFLVANVLHSGLYGTPREAIASRGGSVPVFVKKHIEICDFLGGGVSFPCDPSESSLEDPPIAKTRNRYALASR